MRIFIISVFLSAVFFTFSQSSRATERHTFEVQCLEGDCFKYGWDMTEKDSKSNYLLEARCRGGDCQRYGWRSSDSEGWRFQVTCHRAGCFEEGWISEEFYRGQKVRQDRIVCERKGCLVGGWSSFIGNALTGRSSCEKGDCSKHGGISFWKGQFRRSTCVEKDCYHKGWIFEVF